MSNLNFSKSVWRFSLNFTRVTFTIYTYIVKFTLQGFQKGRVDLPETIITVLNVKRDKI